MTLKKQYENTRPVAIIGLSNFGGLEVLAIEYGINDKLVTCFNYGNGRKAIRRNTIFTTAAGRSYIRKYGRRYYTDEMMRV